MLANNQERTEAHALVRDAFKSNNISLNESIIPDAVFIQKEDGIVVRTIGVFYENLPILHQLDLSALDNGKLAQPARFAGQFTRSTLRELFIEMGLFSLEKGKSRLIMAIHPDHSKFFFGAMGFEKVVCNASYDGNPATIMYKDIE